ncbi:unnamed protein product [Brassicogethes aeneus]|uniref:Fatty acyl-CoA reductase n=1 Tax=Brassicogethes aeneus TaxID=1431903 RepID=A0A9P0FBR9_BRAAE|nr:unnamed protein product [Brassicogethes aeneus]
MALEEKMGVPEFYKGKTIFITGGTGFMGKVLLEKLLRSCPELEKIYVLMRPKKGKHLQERVEQIISIPIFDLIRESNPSQFKKLIPIDGDVTKLNLGLSKEDRQLLVNDVNIIFHAAASVRFDEPIKDAILLNTRGTREVVYLAKEIKNLYALVHTSTTYCNTDRKYIDEIIYPEHGNWKDSIELAEKYDSHILDVLTAKYMNKLPNTYTFSKSMAEHVINDLCKDQIPAIIIRPSIVISSMKEPVKGWIDNFNGPVGLLMGAGKGIMRSMYVNPDVRADYMPVDLVIKAMILVAWDKGLKKEENNLDIEIYNCSNNMNQTIYSGEMVYMGRDLLWDQPLENMLWYPHGSWITTNFCLHYIKIILYHLIPALFVDSLLRLTNHKPLLFKIQRKIYIANMALAYFLFQEWTFNNTNILKLEEQIPEKDKENFGYDKYSPLAIPYAFFKNAVIGAQKYLLKEKTPLEVKRKNATRMWILSVVFNVCWYIGLAYILYYKFDIVGVLLNILYKIQTYFVNL